MVYLVWYIWKLGVQKIFLQRTIVLFSYLGVHIGGEQWHLYRTKTHMYGDTKMELYDGTKKYWYGTTVDGDMGLEKNA